MFAVFPQYLFVPGHNLQSVGLLSSFYFLSTFYNPKSCNLLCYVTVLKNPVKLIIDLIIAVSLIILKKKKKSHLYLLVVGVPF